MGCCLWPASGNVAWNLRFMKYFCLPGYMIRASGKRRTCWGAWMMAPSFMTHRRTGLVGHARRMLTAQKKKKKCMSDQRTVSNIQTVQDYICHCTSTNQVHNVCQDVSCTTLIQMHTGTSFLG